MLVFLLIIVAYTFFGGFTAVCWTDFFQGMLMMLALMLVPIVVYFGHRELLDPTALTTVYEYTDAASGAVVSCDFGGGIFSASWQDIVSGLGWGLGYFGMPHILVRFMSIEKPSMIKKSSTVAIIWVIISLFSAVLIAYFGRMIMGAELLADGSQKLVFIAMSRKFFPAAICGLLLAAIIAASISTADSQLLVASSSFTADLYKPFFRKNATEKRNADGGPHSGADTVRYRLPDRQFQGQRCTGHYGYGGKRMGRIRCLLRPHHPAVPVLAALQLQGCCGRRCLWLCGRLGLAADRLDRLHRHF